VLQSLGLVSAFYKYRRRQEQRVEMDDLRSELREAVIATGNPELLQSGDGVEILDRLINAACDAVDGDDQAVQEAIILEIEQKIEEAETALQRLEAVKGLGG